jgi:Ca2+-binding EF-hand superfamily protein
MGERYFITPFELSHRLRVRTESRGLVGLRGLGTLLRQSEDNGSQLFSIAQDIPKILSDFGVFVNKTEISELVRHLDVRGTGEVCLEDFIAYMTPAMPQARETWVVKSFEKFDPNHTNALELAKVRRLSQAGSVATRLAAKPNSPEVLFQNLIRYYEKDGASSIPREEFFDYYRLVSANTEADFEFVSILQSTWGVGT